MSLLMEGFNFVEESPFHVYAVEGKQKKGGIQ